LIIGAWKLVLLMWRKVSHVVSLQSFGKRLWTSKMRLIEKKTPRLFGEEFHTLSHIFLCIKNANGVRMLNGHTEFLVVLANW
jgi:3,4-dihydroxy-2-butanone 4-phosphate synthase